VRRSTRLRPNTAPRFRVEPHQSGGGTNRVGGATRRRGGKRLVAVVFRVIVKLKSTRWLAVLRNAVFPSSRFAMVM